MVDALDVEGQTRYRVVGKGSGEERESVPTHGEDRVLSALGTVWVKLQAALWVAGAAFCIYEANFFRVIWEHPDVWRPAKYLGLSCLAFELAMLLYTAVILEWHRGVTDWEERLPYIIPMMTFGGVLGYSSFLVAYWSVWGWLTPVIVTVVFFGYVQASHFGPGGKLGNLFMVLLVIGMAYTSHVIEHEGNWHTKK